MPSPFKATVKPKSTVLDDPLVATIEGHATAKSPRMSKQSPQVLNETNRSRQYSFDDQMPNLERKKTRKDGYANVANIAS